MGEAPVRAGGRRRFDYRPRVRQEDRLVVSGVRGSGKRDTIRIVVVGGGGGGGGGGGCFTNASGSS